MSQRKRADPERDFRLVRGAFAVFFTAVFFWIVSRHELRGWALFFAIMSLVSAAINALDFFSRIGKRNDGRRDG